MLTAAGVLRCDAVTHQVLARDDAGGATVAVWGEGGNPHVRVAGADVVPEVDADDGSWRWEARLPAGGPYAITATTADGDERCLVHDLFVGDLWILAGQSNMEGVGRLDGVVIEAPQVRLLDMERRWRLPEEPLHWLCDSPDPVHCGGGSTEELAALRAEARATRTEGVGPGVAFGAHLSSRLGVPVGLIATAHGGTSISQWDPGRRDEGGRSLYGSLSLSLGAAGGRVAGVLWYQGEEDALAGSAHAEAWGRNLDRLIAALRLDAGSPDLPVLVAQLGRVVGEGSPEQVLGWSRVRELQRLHARGGGHRAISTVDLDLGDVIHLDSDSQRRLGRRFAAVAVGDHPGIDVGRVSAAGAVVRIHLEGVQGRLVTHGRVSGLTVHGPGGEVRPVIVDARVDCADPACIVVTLARPVEPDDRIAYGWGLDPVCQLADETDMAVPAFGPLPMG